MAGPYVLGETLGRGATGKVKAGYHTVTGMEVAVKVIRKDFVKDHRQKIAREVAVMRLIDHPNVMKLYDVYDSRRHYFMILEKVSGGELFDYITKSELGRLERHEALTVISQIVQGLEYMHRHNICHRDLKPENLLVDKNHNVKIADFGMAQVIPDGEVLGTFCGSPHYGAPEVISGIKYDGRKSDVWSLGVVCYAITTGMLPFVHDDTLTLLKMVQRGEFTMPEHLDEDVQDLIAKMLTKDVKARISSKDIKDHRCFKGPDGTNKYFPEREWPSPALEMMHSNPITCEDDIDPNILLDLEGLGWGSAELIKSKLLEHTQTGEAPQNLEYVFYQLLAARNRVRREEGRSIDEVDRVADALGAHGFEPESPAVVSFQYPDSPATPKSSHVLRRRGSIGSSGSRTPKVASSRAKKSYIRQPTSGISRPRPGQLSTEARPPLHPDAEPLSAPMKKPVTLSKPPLRNRSKKGMIITVDKKADAPDVVSTPVFHRRKIVSDDPTSPYEPETPSEKRSWLRKLFKRRPSVDDMRKKSNKRASLTKEDLMEIDTPAEERKE